MRSRHLLFLFLFTLISNSISSSTTSAIPKDSKKSETNKKPVKGKDIVSTTSAKKPVLAKGGSFSSFAGCIKAVISGTCTDRSSNSVKDVEQIEIDISDDRVLDLDKPFSDDFAPDDIHPSREALVASPIRLKSHEFNLDKYRRKSVIKDNGKVTRLYIRKDVQKVFKRFLYTDPLAYDVVFSRAEKEYDIQTELRHPNIARAYKLVGSKQKNLIGIEMEKAGDKDLRDVISEAVLSEKIVSRITEQVSIS
jgi:hypothetical protein